MAEQDAVRSILVAASGFVYAPTSSTNLGDRAQLTCTVERLRAAFPGWRLVAVANSLNDEADVDDLEVSYSAIRYLTVTGHRAQSSALACRQHAVGRCAPFSCS